MKTEERGWIATAHILHFGVKGMKWGVRRAEQKIAKGDKKFEKSAGTFKKMIEIHNEAADRANRMDVDRINNKPEYKNADFTRDTPFRQKYYKEHQNAYLDRVREVAAEHGTNPSGTRKYQIVEDSSSLTGWYLTTTEAKHDDSTPELKIKIPITYKDGWIVKIGDAVMHSSEFVENFLEHYGVKGMKWGVRKNRGPATAVTVRESGLKGKKLKTTGGENRPTSTDAARAATIGQVKKKSGVRALSDQDLQTYTRRLNLEAQAKRLDYERSSAGKKFILSLLGQTGKSAAQQVANDVASKQVKKLLVKGAVAAAV